MKGRCWFLPIFLFLFIVVVLYHEPSISAQDSFLLEPQLIKLTDTDDSYWPSWSPDGSRIAFYKRFDYYINGFGRDTKEPICHLWVMNADGSDAHQLWDGTIRGYIGWPLWPPQWSGDGDFIAVDHIREPSYAIVLDSRSGKVVLDSLSTGWCYVPRFSPEGSTMIFSQLTPWWESEEETDVRSLILLDVRSGISRVIHKTGFNSETEWREAPSNWSVNGQVLRVRDSWRFGRRGNTLYYYFYDVVTGELLLTSLDRAGSHDLPDPFLDPTKSPSMHWQVIAPNINDEEETPDLRGNAWFRKGLTLVKVGGRGLTPEEYAPSTDGRYIFSYQWHPREDQLLIAAGEKSLDPDQEEISNIYVIIFPD